MIAVITLSGIEFKLVREDDEDGDVAIGIDGAPLVTISRKEAKTLAAIIDLSAEEDPSK